MSDLLILFVFAVYFSVNVWLWTLAISQVTLLLIATALGVLYFAVIFRIWGR